MPVQTKLLQLFTEFFENEKTSGIILLLCTAISIAVSSSPFGSAYIGFWHLSIAGHTLQHWINDGLMAVFFLLVGLEIERELYIGKLSDPKSASLPIAAALGGMVTPALFHFLLNRGSETIGGVGIPMATDIAFALGVLALLGDRIPLSLKIFLSALAIIDDLGAIVVIAVFYVSGFSFSSLTLALLVFAALVLLNRRGVNLLWPYLLLGVVMWCFMLNSGVQATIAGVMLAFAIPFRGGEADSPSYKLQHLLHKPVAFLIMPVFALANTGIALTGNWTEGLFTSNSLGIVAGLLGGKPLGITLFSYVAIKLGLSRLPPDLRWKQVVGAGFLGGIGFTMSIFITLLAFDDPQFIRISKLAVLLASLLAGSVGYLILRQTSADSRSPG